MPLRGLFALLLAATAVYARDTDLTRWMQEAHDVTIVRDDWGIAHISGKTDADAVFGMEYAQAEDDFYRVETNYINALGRLAEVEGEAKVYQDLRMKLFVNPDELQRLYANSPAWLQSLMNAFADGLNYYLYKHPEVAPRVIKRFEPWMALSFTEGSIGGDIEHVSLDELKSFYGKTPVARRRVRGPEPAPTEPSGSNGIAIAPSNTRDGHALLLINPHTSFFFRSELQMSSGQGLDAYGAVTWGQFFVYQGFNEHAGWMHTSSGVDAVDEYLETVVKRGNKTFYKYGQDLRPVTSETISVPFKATGQTDGGLDVKTFTIYRTHHGPIIREESGKWVSVRLMQKPIEALEQSYLRTKATNYKSYLETMQLKANSSNNTIFADSEGDIAYFHGNFIPRRDTRFDFTKPVDGSDPATKWKDLLRVEETPHLLNPDSGWLYNSNNWPWSAAGPSSPKREDYPPYVETGTESARGLHAIKLLKDRKDFTLDSLITAAYDSYLPWFDKTLPALINAWDRDPKPELTEQITALRDWDRRWSVASVPTSLAVFWGEEIRTRVLPEAKKAGMLPEDYIAARATPQELLAALQAASNKLTTDFGTWRIEWGAINRFQRLTGDIVQPFSDAGLSTPVGFTSSVWGSLASFGARAYPGPKKWYGTSGNSFVAVVEFGPKVHAKAVTAGGESGHSNSSHFNDQAERYATGNLREVYFYSSQLQGHTEREYHPGD